MKKLTILIAYLLLSLPAFALAADPRVGVSVDTPAGRVDVNRPPPPQPVVVVQPPAQPKTVVVEKAAAQPPPAPSAGCSCNLIASRASALGFLALAPVLSLPLILRKFI